MRPSRPLRTALSASAIVLAACQAPTGSDAIAPRPGPEALAQGNPVPTWVYTVLALPAGTWTHSAATGINASGTMSGYALGSSGSRPVWWLSNTPATLPTPGANFAGTSYDVNASNVVVGSVWFFSAGGAGYPRTPAKWTSGAFSNLTTLGYAGEALAINDGGVAVGWSKATSAGVERPVKWTANGTLVDILPVGAASGRAVDINMQGDIVGTVVFNGIPFGWKWGANGFNQNLGSLQPVGGYAGQVNGIDDWSEPVGRQVYGNLERAVFWTPNGTLIPVTGAATGSITYASSPVRRMTGTNASGAFTWRFEAAPIALPVPSGTTFSLGLNVNLCGSMVGRADVSGTSKAIRWTYSGGCDTP